MIFLDWESEIKSFIMCTTWDFVVCCNTARLTSGNVILKDTRAFSRCTCCQQDFALLWQRQLHLPRCLLEWSIWGKLCFNFIADKWCHQHRLRQYNCTDGKQCIFGSDSMKYSNDLHMKHSILLSPKLWSPSCYLPNYGPATAKAQCAYKSAHKQLILARMCTVWNSSLGFLWYASENCRFID